jgi:hypothetical protein
VLQWLCVWCYLRSQLNSAASYRSLCQAFCGGGQL